MFANGQAAFEAQGDRDQLVSIERMNIENPQTMIRPSKLIRVTLFALMTFPLFVSAGCQPAVKEEVVSSGSSADVASVPKNDRVDSVISSDTAKVRSEAVNIGGDLDSVDWNSLAGQEITVTGDLVVVDTYDLVRRGQVKVARKRLYVPTSHIDPNDADPNATSFEGGSNVAKVTSARKFNDQATITIDDGSADQNVFPLTLFPDLGKTHATVRVGSVIHGVTGQLVKAGSRLLLVPNEPLRWTAAERPQRPSVGDADVTVCSFNVLNYFTTIDDGGNNARGADSESELKRQEEKLVSAIIALQADVMGLMELENNLEAEDRLVAALNRKLGKEVFKGCGLPDQFGSTPGGQNPIRCGIIYRSDRVESVGSVSTIRDDVFDLARAPIVQQLKSAEGRPFTVIVNHFKSKGGGDNADEANKNKGDGQAAYNAARRAQSLAICDYVETLKQVDEKPRVLILGDLNAYAQEDPIDAMRAKGLVDLREHVEAAGPAGNKTGRHYSFIYRGQSGCLDHAMATEWLAADVTGIATWHINADEPRFLDYNKEHNPQPLFEVNPFRSSDHDPVLIGLRN